MLKKNSSTGSIPQSTLNSFSVIIPLDLVSKLIDFFIAKKKQDLLMHGFQKGTIPEAYIKEHFKKSLLSHIEKIFFCFYAQDLFVKNFSGQGIYVPRVFSFDAELNLNTFFLEFKYQYTSHLSDSERTGLDDGKKIKFPERKKYKDLDRQALLTFAQEKKNKENADISCISEGDWIAVRVTLGDEKGKIIDERLTAKLWIYVTAEAIDREIRMTFVGKKKGDKLVSAPFFLAELLSTDFLSHFFLIVIEDHISHLCFDFDLLGDTYGYTPEGVIHKMIEIFSLRNDISLKKEKSQLVLKHFLEKIKISLDKEIILEHEYMIKNRIVKNADYLLYQSDANFLGNIKKLACRQAMEKILIDYLIHKYKIKPEEAVVHVYVNILQRHRLKDFLYFDTANLYDNTMKFVPIFDHVMKQMALRERAIEYLIDKLT